MNSGLGLEGWGAVALANYERRRRNKKRLAIFTLAAIILVGICAVFYAGRASAAQGYQLTLRSYTTANGHTADTASYLGTWRLYGGSTMKECESKGEQALRYYQAGQLDGSPTLPVYSCEPLPDSTD